MKVMDVLKRWMGRDPHGPACQKEDCRRERLEETDRRLHEQATRLHVLEWEAYGNRRPHRRDH